MSDPAPNNDPASANETEKTPTSSKSHMDKPGIPAWLIVSLVVGAAAIGVLGEYLVGRVAANAMMKVEGRFQHMFFPEPHGQLGDPPEWLLERRMDMMKNNSVGYGAFGAILIGIVGLLLGVAYPNSNPLLGLLMGAGIGLLAGAISGPIGYYIEDTLFKVDMEGAVKAAANLGLTFLSFGLAGALIAVCAGPASGLVKVFVNGILAAIAAYLAYILISIAVFPIGFPESSYPLDPGVRYTLFVCLGLCPAIAAVLTLRQDQPAAIEDA